MVAMAIHNAIIKNGDIFTKSITSQGLVTPANGYVTEGKRTKVCRLWLSGDKIYLLCRSKLSRSLCGAWKLSNDRTSTGHVTGMKKEAISNAY